MFPTKTSLILFIFITVCITLSLCSRSAPPRSFRKQLQGPAAEFSTFQTPDPSTVGIRADSSLFRVQLTPTLTSNSSSSLSSSPSLYYWSQSFPVEYKEQFSVTFTSPHIDNFEIWIQPPLWPQPQKIVDSMFTGHNSLGKKEVSLLGIDGASANATTYTFFEPPTGDWVIEVRSSNESLMSKLLKDANTPHAFVNIENKSKYKLFSHLKSYNLEQGEFAGIVVRMYDESISDVKMALSKEETPAASVGVIQTAELVVTFPDGERDIVQMKDDGLSNDGKANDGEYGAMVATNIAGSYIAHAIVHGQSGSGKPFVRTSQHLIKVTGLEMTMTGVGYAKYIPDDEITKFYVGVDTVVGAAKRKRYVPGEAGGNGIWTVKVFAEVWGTPIGNGSKDYVGIGWMQAMVDPEQMSIGGRNGSMMIAMELNVGWMTMAKAGPPFQLRNIAIQDRDTNTMIAYNAVVTIIPDDHNNMKMLNATIAKSVSHHAKMNQPVKITEEMRLGKRPQEYRTRRSDIDEQGKLLLVHGYCSQAVWPENNFTDAVVFEDFSQSRSNDEFALLIRELGDSYPSFSIAAHSQGGLASLHLYTYYWSGLDRSPAAVGGKGRLIQSVGSPYRGCSLAGVIADIGTLFGFGCGTNFDLSTDGAALWYSKIPKHADGPESAVWYYTTSFDESWWTESYCVMAANLILYSPNDGTCEAKFAKLTSGHALGNTAGECHIAGMRYNPQTMDLQRNADINALAAR